MPRQDLTHPAFVQCDEAYQRGSGIDPSGSFIIGGQIRSEPPRLFLL